MARRCFFATSTKTNHLLYAQHLCRRGSSRLNIIAPLPINSIFEGPGMTVNLGVVFRGDDLTPETVKFEGQRNIVLNTGIGGDSVFTLHSWLDRLE